MGILEHGCAPDRAGVALPLLDRTAARLCRRATGARPGHADCRRAIGVRAQALLGVLPAQPVGAATQGVAVLPPQHRRDGRPLPPRALAEHSAMSIALGSALMGAVERGFRRVWP